MEAPRPQLEARLAEHHADSFGWALACCDGDRTEAEEVLQATYLKVLDGGARFAGRATFRTWLFSVIRRTAAERRRRARLHRLLELRWLPQASAQPPDEPERAVRHSRASARLRAALATLPERQRQIVHLVFYQGLSIAEAAAVLALSLGSARTHYARAKTRLRGVLGEEKPE